MSETQNIWEIRQGETLIGKLTIFDEDPPWYSALFNAAPEFEPQRALFNEGENLRSGEDADGWAAWMTRVGQLGWRLIRLGDQAETNDFILYIYGNEAEFRPRFNTAFGDKN